MSKLHVCRLNVHHKTGEQWEFAQNWKAVIYPWSESTGMIPFWSTNSIYYTMSESTGMIPVWSTPQIIHTEWQLPLSGVHSIMMEKLCLPGEGGWCTPTPFTISTITYKVVVYVPPERVDTLPSPPISTQLFLCTPLGSNFMITV